MTTDHPIVPLERLMRFWQGLDDETRARLKDVAEDEPPTLPADLLELIRRNDILSISTWWRGGPEMAVLLDPIREFIRNQP